ncbi:unnamed protein product, partial [Rhizoctonia solani]
SLPKASVGFYQPGGAPKILGPWVGRMTDDFSIFLLIHWHLIAGASGTWVGTPTKIARPFALLQAAHLLLFGRPLLWGLVGAKTISPFGLLEGYLSSGFKPRLKVEYHSKSGEDGTDTIQIVRFLRDFVIDFGPADLDREESTGKKTELSPTLVANNEDSISPQIPLVQMNPDVTNALRNEKDADQDTD